MLKHALVFPGQGSQSVGMLSALAECYPVVRETVDNVSLRLNEDIWELIAENHGSRLDQTEYTQVAMLTADVAVYRVLEMLGIRRAQVMAGHSLGEYAALVCSGSLSLSDAAFLVRERGRLMQDAVPAGAGSMAAIVGLTDQQVRDVCAQASVNNLNVMPANYNAIGQVVIAGHTPAVEHAMRLAEDMSARLVKKIAVSVPCHCPLLIDAADIYAQALLDTEFKIPEVTVISNVDLSEYTTVDQIRRLLKEQLYSPVRWVETIQAIKNKEVNLIIECGPGSVLTGLVKRIDKSIPSMSAAEPSNLLLLLERYPDLAGRFS